MLQMDDVLNLIIHILLLRMHIYQLHMYKVPPYIILGLNNMDFQLSSNIRNFILIFIYLLQDLLF